MADIDDHRLRMRQALAAGEDALVAEFKESIGLDAEDRAAIAAQARALVERIRAKGGGGLVETFLARFPLGSQEGQALMGLAEALLRVPDAPTADALLDDKIRQGEWHREAGTRGLRIEAMVAALALARHLLAGPAMVEAGIRPLIRLAASRLVHLFGGQFVFAPDIDQAVGKARVRERDGVRFSYDMLGEAARTAADADRYFRRYRDAIARIAGRPADLDHNAAMSVKLSALHPRYEYAQQDRLQAELVPRVIALARAAKAANIGMTIDAEEAERLDLSLDVIAEVAADPQLAGWSGLGIVVQAYGKRALPLIAWADALARRHDRRIMVRLVKGAYWDSEIKRAQVLGLAGFPVFTHKAATDLSYLAAARSLLTRSALYPQFATHNAQTAAAVLHLARKLGVAPQSFEMQRLHGMGAELHRLLRQDAGTRTRIYAPVGPYRDLLPYLVRRLLENGASASFVQQLANRSVPVAEIIADPAEARDAPAPGVQAPDAIFAPSRRNSRGIDLSDPLAVDDLLAACAPFRGMRWMAAPLINGARCEGVPRSVMNPAAESEVVGFVAEADADQVAAAVEGAAVAWPGWAARPVSERTAPLRAAADLYEQNRPELISLLVREAGKTLPDAVAEVREAVDFLRYYAGEAERHPQGEGRGVFACISPWNFPLAIFTGQIAAALAAGNAVIAKPAQQTPLIAFRAVQLLHAAGVPASVLHCLPGDGARVGDALTRERRLAGVAFTGSLATARRIETQMAHHLAADAPLIAETGGLNAMIVDSTALPEQVVRDVLASAFQSAGQRCSALRVLYLQQDIAAPVLEMLSGAMNELRLGDPWELSTDIGPVIDAGAARRIKHHVDSFAGRGALIGRLGKPGRGTFIAPAILRVNGIAEIGGEVFGPVLHVATFLPHDLARVIDEINASGYGLTFGMHTRITARMRDIWQRLKVGNIYINRNQIGAVVGSQPFGGEGLSGTGPKAGGPHYLPRFQKPRARQLDLQPQIFPGPTGESNTLYLAPRGRVLCLGPGDDDRRSQVALAERFGNEAVVPARNPAPEKLADDDDIAVVAYWRHDDRLADIRRALSRREGPIVALMTSRFETDRLVVERHVCIDETAAGGNITLLAQPPLRHA